MSGRSSWRLTPLTASTSRTRSAGTLPREIQLEMLPWDLSLMALANADCPPTTSHARRMASLDMPLFNAGCVIPVNAYCVLNSPDHSTMGRKSQDVEPSEFWQRVVETWRKAGLPTTQSGIAREFKTAQSTAQRWHDGTALPGRETLIAIAEKGHTTLDYLIAGWSPKRRVRGDDRFTELLRLWDDMDESAQGHVLDSARGQVARAREVREPPANKSLGRKTA